MDIKAAIEIELDFGDQGYAGLGFPSDEEDAAEEILHAFADLIKKQAPFILMRLGYNVPEHEASAEDNIKVYAHPFEKNLWGGTNDEGEQLEEGGDRPRCECGQEYVIDADYPGTGTTVDFYEAHCLGCNAKGVLSVERQDGSYNFEPADPNEVIGEEE